MKLNLIKIGNSRGIRLPKALLEQCKFKDLVIAEVKDGKLILSTPKAVPRAGWQEAFKAMAKAGDDQLIDAPGLELELEDDQRDWQW